MKKTTFFWCALLAILFLACQFPDDSFARTVFSLTRIGRNRVIVAPVSIPASKQRFAGNKVSSFFFKRPLQVKPKMMQVVKAHCYCITSSRLFAVSNVYVYFFQRFS